MKLISIELQALQIVSVLDTAQDYVLRALAREDGGDSSSFRSAFVHLFAAYATADRLADEMKNSPRYASNASDVASSLKTSLSLLSAAPPSRRTLEQTARGIGNAREAMLSVAVAHDDCAFVAPPAETQDVPVLPQAG